MILSVKDVHKSYGKEKVLKGISFEIEKPQIIALVGPNGSGKSTLLNIITNLLTADSGNVTVLGKSNRNPDIFKDISFMQDNSVLYEYLTGYDHLQFIGDVQGISRKQITDTADWIGISSYLNKKVGNYSLGMKQHLLLTMAVLNAPKLLILDEPLNGLDPTSAIRVRELLVELHKSGTTILLSSHNLAEIDRVTSTILFLKNGELIKENILQHENICYELVVNDIVKAQSVLEEETIPVELMGSKLRIYMEGSSLGGVFRILEKHEIKLLDLEKIVLGTEERYQKIFGEKGDKQ
ncbi:ABC transporter ATP-binding protein [Sporosarcina siberiensis]|uniref:ABC transporter ATP-binding protein n=1 Tax=Sporosarcina siberiensis TaxID=1365606 RepID=A0ABW4SCU8_9BACL